MSIEILFPILALAFAVGGVIFFDRYGKRVEARSRKNHPAE